MLESRSRCVATDVDEVVRVLQVRLNAVVVVVRIDHVDATPDQPITREVLVSPHLELVRVVRVPQRAGVVGFEQVDHLSLDHDGRGADEPITVPVLTGAVEVLVGLGHAGPVGQAAIVHDERARLTDTAIRLRVIADTVLVRVHAPGVRRLGGGGEDGHEVRDASGREGEGEKGEASEQQAVTVHRSVSD